MTLGEKIYKLRTEKNLSQGDLSEMLEVSRQSISKWENGAATPDLDKIIKLSEIFGITIDELVKSENVSAFEEPKNTPVMIKKESCFPPRKIVGTVLLSVSLIITFICFIIASLEGAVSGIFLSSPLILCGIVCFAFRKNVGLWCGWAAFFAVDMYIRLAMGINRYNVLNTFIWTYDMNYARLAIAYIQLFVLIALIVMTMLRFRKIPLENKKAPIIFWAVYAVLKIAMAVFSASHLYRVLLHNLMATANTWIYTLCSSLYSWIYTGFFAAAVVLTVRYFYTRKHKLP